MNLVITKVHIHDELFLSEIIQALEPRIGIPKSEQSFQHLSFDRMEVQVGDRLFDSPVFVRDGYYLVQEIAGVEDAIDFLQEWPENDRDVIYETTWRTCCDAHNGFKPISVAHNALEVFAKKRNILEKPDVTIPWMATKTPTGGLIPV